MSEEALSAVRGSWVMRTRVESWRGEDMLAEDIPVAAGAEDTDRTLRVPERVTLTVPKLDRGANYDPAGQPDHPLAPYGQRLRVSVGVDLGNGVTEWLQRGWFLVRDYTTRGDVVNVEAVGLLALIDEARFVAPFQPTGTLASTLRALVEPALTVDIDSGLVDRAVPDGMWWDEDRLGALLEVCDCWPAEARVTEDGYLAVTPVAEPSTPVLTLTEGAGGTVVEWEGEGSRDGACTAVVVRGTTTDGGQVQGVVYDTDTTSPLAVSGPFNPLPVPMIFSSPFLPSVAYCRAAAAWLLRRQRRSAGRRVTASLVPHPGLQTGDLVALEGDTVTGLATVEALALPLTPGGGPMSLSLRVV